MTDGTNNSGAPGMNPGVPPGPQAPVAGATGRQVVSPGFKRPEKKPFPLVPVLAGGAGVVVVFALFMFVLSSMGGGISYAEDVAQHLPEETQMMWAVSSPDAVFSALGDLGIYVEGLEEVMSGDDPDDILVEEDDAMDKSALREIGIDAGAPVGGGEFAVERENFRATVVSFGAVGGADEMEAFADLLDWDDTEDEEFGDYAAITSASDEESPYLYTGSGLIRIGKRMLMVQAFNIGGAPADNFDEQREVIQAALEYLAELEEDDSLAASESFALAMKQDVDADLVGIAFLTDDDRERLEDEFIDADELLFMMAGLALDNDGASLNFLAGFESEEAQSLTAIQALKIDAGTFNGAPGPAAGLFAFALDQELAMSWISEQLDTVGDDIDEAYEEFEDEVGVDLEELIAALDFTGGVVIPDEIGEQLMQRAMRGRFSLGDNPLFEEDFYMFFGVEDHEVVLAALEDIEDVLGDQGVEVDSDEVGDGVMLTLENRGEEFAIGVTEDTVWVGAPDAVEDAMEGTDKTLRSESRGLISALPSRAGFALTADFGALLEEVVEGIGEELDVDLPDSADLFVVASASVYAQGQTVRAEVSIPFDGNAIREAMADR